ncbi:PIR protein, putative [Plasmodium sp. gorilla clade G1]|nr:PIR protein, putative [Plasmodium sp. gorilla clade G1]
MKLHYSIILLFVHLLNILVTSSYAHNKTKPCITTHIPTTTSRMFSECDIDMRNYDNDQDMKSVKENFDRQTSGRFEEYEKRIQEKRRICKEQCDKDIQEIILKDKIDKSLAEKVEKGCLKCGCGLGGVAASVGIFGPIAISELKKAALVAASQKGIDAGMATAIKILKHNFGLGNLTSSQWTKLISAETYKNQPLLASTLKEISDEICVMVDGTLDGDAICMFKGLGDPKFSTAIATHTKTAATDAAAKAASVETAEIDLVNAASSTYSTVITSSVVAIVVIVLVMLLIYLILRYRRKKKMNKKQQYTKLLKE